MKLLDQFIDDKLNKSELLIKSMELVEKLAENVSDLTKKINDLSKRLEEYDRILVDHEKAIIVLVQRQQVLLKSLKEGSTDTELPSMFNKKKQKEVKPN